MNHKGTKFFLGAFGVFIVLAIVFFIISNSRVSSNVIFNIEGNYEKGEILEGILDLNLQEGELVPASSKVIFVNNGTTYEYNLSDLIDFSTIEGNFYVQDSQVSGFGEGYGRFGFKKVYPDVYFSFNIYSESTGGGGDDDKDKNKTKDDKDKNKTKDDKDKDKDKTEEDGDSGSPITGQISLRFHREVQGNVSYGERFIYPLNEGETAEVIEKSVGTETRELSIDYLDLGMNEEGLVITTNYFKNELGFGEEYIQRGRKSLPINLSSLNLVFSEGSLLIYVVYENKEIISLKTILKDKFPVSQRNEQERSWEETPDENITYVSPFKSQFNLENLSLSEEELSILLDNFPNETISRSVKQYRKWIIAKFTFGDYSAEYGYDSSLEEDVLENLMEDDRIRWLKDLARKFYMESSSSKELSSFSENYDLTQ